jgi:hypothetical protein
MIKQVAYVYRRQFMHAQIELDYTSLILLMKHAYKRRIQNSINNHFDQVIQKVDIQQTMFL